MRTLTELHKIKEAFSYAVLDLLNVYDELLATGRINVDMEDFFDEPTVNDILKNEKEFNEQSNDIICERS